MDLIKTTVSIKARTYAEFYKNKEKVNYKITKYGMFIEVPNNKKDQRGGSRKDALH